MGFEGNILLLGLVLTGVIYSLIVAKFTGSIILKSIPSIIGTAVIGYMLYKINFTETHGFESLGYFVTCLMAFLVVLGNSVTNLIQYLLRKKKLPQSKE